MTTHANFVTRGPLPRALTLTVTSTSTVPDVPGAFHTSSTRMLALPVRHVAVYAGGFIAMFIASLAVFLTR